MMNDRRAVLRLLICAGTTGAALAQWASTAAAQPHHGGAMPKHSADSNLLVFAAATLKPALDEVAGAYRAAERTEVTIAYGPTPMLAKNIADGAPADVFFSADVTWMDYLADRKLIVSETRFNVVGNDVVLIQGAGASTGQPMEISPSFPIAAVVGSGPLAMCNPDSHPAGRYGRISLERLGLWDAIASKVAIVENPQIAAAMVARGDVPAAVVFATDIHGLSGVKIAGTFPEQSHGPISYPVAMTSGARHPTQAALFLAHLRSASARRVFDRFGYRQALRSRENAPSLA